MPLRACACTGSARIQHCQRPVFTNCLLDARPNALVLRLSHRGRHACLHAHRGALPPSCLCLCLPVPPAHSTAPRSLPLSSLRAPVTSPTPHYLANAVLTNPSPGHFPAEILSGHLVALGTESNFPAWLRGPAPHPSAPGLPGLSRSQRTKPPAPGGGGGDRQHFLSMRVRVSPDSAWPLGSGTDTVQQLSRGRLTASFLPNSLEEISRYINTRPGHSCRHAASPRRGPCVGASRVWASRSGVCRALPPAAEAH